MKTIKTRTTAKVLANTLRDIQKLVPKFRDCAVQLGKKIHTALEIDRETAMEKIKTMGLPVSMIRGLEKVGAGLVHEQVFLNGSAAAHMAEALKFKDQKLLAEKGVQVVVGGTAKAPEIEVMTLIQIPNRLMRQVIHPTEHRFRTIPEQVEYRAKQPPAASKKPRYEVQDGCVVFHVRKWPIAEIKTIIGNI